jgi:putative endonuclease
MTSTNKRVLYIGVTNNILRRVEEHQLGMVKGFTSRYHVCKLVYAEEFEDVRDAIQREKTLKAWKREWKMELIEQANPHWEDITLALGAEKE